MVVERVLVPPDALEEGDPRAVGDRAVVREGILRPAGIQARPGWWGSPSSR